MNTGPLAAAVREALAGRGVSARRADRAAACAERLLGSALVRNRGCSFLLTGDIPAMWLRDSTWQLKPLLALAGEIPELAGIAREILRTQVFLIRIDPRANAFNPGPTGAAMRHDFRDQSPWVYERKYALDSLCAPLVLAHELFVATGSLGHLDHAFVGTADTIVSVMTAGQAHEPGSYRFVRRLGRRRGTMPNGGDGRPVAPTGMTWSAFRPSDDACRYGYHVPANALAAVALTRLADLLELRGGSDDLAGRARSLADEIRRGIETHGTVDSPYGRIHAYEVDGLGNALLLDDANVPSLLSLPELGFCQADNPVYVATRQFALGPANPCWTAGPAIHGIGSEHTRRGWVWPLAIAMEGLTAADPDERERALARLEATAGSDGAIHESVDAARPQRFTRAWFSWAEMAYVELVLRHAAARRSGDVHSGG